MAVAVRQSARLRRSRLTSSPWVREPSTPQLARCSAKLAGRTPDPGASASLPFAVQVGHHAGYTACSSGGRVACRSFSSRSMVLCHEGVKMASSAKKGMAIDIGISENNRAKISDNLSRLLADTYTLYLM